MVKKSRIESFPDTDHFPFSYEEIARRYGKDILERDAVAQELANKQQIEEIESLIDLFKVPEDVTQKWLDKSGSERWEEMPKDAIHKCIEFLKSKIKGES